MDPPANFSRGPLYGDVAAPSSDAPNPITTPNLKSSGRRCPMSGGTVGTGGYGQGGGNMQIFSQGFPLCGRIPPQDQQSIPLLPPPPGFGVAPTPHGGRSCFPRRLRSGVVRLQNLSNPPPPPRPWIPPGPTLSLSINPHTLYLDAIGRHSLSPLLLSLSSSSLFVFFSAIRPH